ncbi:MAG: GIY-YIG nuclease family protein [Quinella sp. 1Q5]|nr:GIY-YIG nuclease family protein [Quinella sp. 1Q5]
MKDNNKNPKTCQTVVFSVYVLWCYKTDMNYVGVTCQKRVYTRIRQHKKGKQFVDKEIKRIGWEGNWDWWIVEEHVPSEQISEREQYWVKLFDCVYPKGYNKTCGGISKLTVSDDTREKIRQRALARDYSGERNPHYGKHHTDEAKAAIAAKLSGENSPRYGKPPANKGVPHTAEELAKMSTSHMGEKNHFYGKHHTTEAKEKNRQAHLGKPSWNKGVPHSEEAKAKMREKALAREAAKRAAKAVAEENLAVAHFRRRQT